METKKLSHIHRQRLFLGLICGLLPICCLLFGLIGGDSNPVYWDGSISATYYANSNVWMIGSLILASFYFFTYKGYDIWDNILTTISSVSALGVVIFPTQLYNTEVMPKLGLFCLPANLSDILHAVSAGVLFVSFAVMILFQFTKTNNKPRKITYIICGVTILLAALGVAFASQITKLFGGWLSNHWVWFAEFVMLEAFAIAWIVKSKALIRATNQ